MRNRLPTRFPEELEMEIDRDQVKVRYDNIQKQSVYYQLSVAYHFVKAHEKTYIWQPVTFYFEIRNGKWELIGDRWVREWELEFE